MDKCPKCGKKIETGAMGIHEKKPVICVGCGIKWEVTMHGNGALFEEVKEIPPKKIEVPPEKIEVPKKGGPKWPVGSR